MRRAAIAVAALLVGCGSKSGPSSMLVDDFALKVATWGCGIVSKCSFQVANYSVQACLQTYNPAADLKTAINAGRATYDGSQAQACIDALNGLSCSALTGSINPPPACRAALKGAVAAGGSCRSTWVDFDCVSGYCQTGSAASCSGTCAAYAQQGGACSATIKCDVGLVCSNGRCSPPPAQGGNGATCNPNNQGSDCISGYYCFGAPSATTGTCTAQVAAGGACGADLNHALAALNLAGGQCGSGLVCKGLIIDNTTGSVTPGICAIPVDEAASCTPASAGKSTVTGCKYGLVCPSGTCARPPASGACANDLYTTCVLNGVAFGTGGNYCDSTTTCQPPKAAGAPCASSAECGGLSCVSSVCAAICHES